MLNLRIHSLVWRLDSCSMHICNLKTMCELEQVVLILSVYVLLIRMSDWCMKDTNWLNWWQIRILSSLHTITAWQWCAVLLYSVFFFFWECAECPGSDKFQDLVENFLEGNAIIHVTFKQQISTGKLTLETDAKQNGEFADMLIAKLVVLHLHCFVVVQHALYWV